MTPRKNPNSGFMLLELMLAVAVFTIAIIPMVKNAEDSKAVAVNSNNMRIAKSLAQQTISQIELQLSEADVDTETGEYDGDVEDEGFYEDIMDDTFYRGFWYEVEITVEAITAEDLEPVDEDDLNGNGIPDDEENYYEEEPTEEELLEKWEKEHISVAKVILKVYYPGTEEWEAGDDDPGTSNPIVIVTYVDLTPDPPQVAPVDENGENADGEVE